MQCISQANTYRDHAFPQTQDSFISYYIWDDSDEATWGLLAVIEINQCLKIW